MYLIHKIYQLFVFCGCWRPLSWTTPFKKFLYSVYYFYVLLSVFGVTLCQLLDLVLNARTQDEFSETFYLFVSMLISCYKVYSVTNSRGNIMNMTNILESEPFRPMNEEELEIRRTYMKRIDSSTICYAILVESTVFLYSLVALLGLETRKLPCRMWLPFSQDSLLAYTFTYVQQVMSLFAGSLMHVACDSLFCGLLMHTCSQIEILHCRLKMMKRDESGTIKLCVRYHELIYRFATMVNEEFEMVILVQFAMSTLTICFNLYLLTGETTDSRLLEITMYSACMFTQIYIYCWHGNQVKLKSLDIPATIFALDWTSLRESTKNDLLLMMMRASYPIEINSIYVVSINLESFVTLLKTSYSAYNVLQRGKG